MQSLQVISTLLSQKSPVILWLTQLNSQDISHTSSTNIRMPATQQLLFKGLNHKNLRDFSGVAEEKSPNCKWTVHGHTIKR